MKTIESEKAFDCVKMKDEIQALIYAETKDMDSAELLAYFNQYAASRPKNVKLSDKDIMEAVYAVRYGK